MPLLKINSPAEVLEGESYTVRLTVTNRSTKAGQPVEAMLAIGMLSSVDSIVLVPEQITDVHFGPNESKAIDYIMDVPSGSGGRSGTVQAWVADPEGFILAEASENLKVSVAVPSIEIAHFHYVYKATNTWLLLGSMIHGQDITHIGFTFQNNGQFNISDVSVDMLIEWNSYIIIIEAYLLSPRREFPYPGGSLELKTLLDQYLRTIGQPFVLPPGETSAWFAFTPAWKWFMVGEVPFGAQFWEIRGCPKYKATARIKVAGVLVATAIMGFSVQYDPYG